MDEKDLLDLKKQIDSAKVKINQLEGRQKGLMDTLAEDWGCDSIDEAKQKLEDLEAEITKLDKKIKKGIQKIEEQYEFE